MRPVLRIGVCALLLLSSGVVARAQTAPREVRIEVRDRKGQMIPEARVEFPTTGDSATTDSLGVARTTIEADSTITITIRKIGYEPRGARFSIGRAPAFVVRAVLGDLGQRLPEVTVTAEYPGEPWRSAYEERRRRSSGSYRDRSFFSIRQPALLEDWFNGMPGARVTSRGLQVTRCPRLGVWIDGIHLTGSGLSSTLALQQVTPNDIAAVELYRMAQQQAQFSDPNREDCSVLIWTRNR